MFYTQGSGLDMLGIYIIGKTNYSLGCAIHEVFVTERLKQEAVIRFTSDYKLVVGASKAGFFGFLYKVANK